MRVLVAEDDEGLRSVLERGLKENGYVVDALPDGERALAFLRTYEYDVAVIDWRMPKISGLDVVQELRRAGGADDYLVKPLDFGELLARVRALQRRPPAVHGPQVVLGNLVFNPATRQVHIGSKQPPLTGTELSILEILMRRHPNVVERRAIALHVWDEEADALGSNTIDVHLARLRAKLVGGRVRIETVRGVGYRMTAT